MTQEESMLIDKATKLSISRVPRKIKVSFVNFANEDFEGDYGALLHWLYEQAMEYQQMKYSLFNGLLNSKEQIPVTQDEKKPEIKMLSGKRIEMKGGDKQDGKSK